MGSEKELKKVAPKVAGKVMERGAGVSFGEHNISVPTIPVFPGDQVTWFSPDAEKELFTRTIEQIRWNGNNAMIMLAIARARLSMPGASAWLKQELLARRFPNGTIALNRRGAQFNGAGIYTEQFASSAAISELLLRSVGSTIRVFPAWPKDRDAGFCDLRAQGGVLVTAAQKGGRVVKLETVSTVGGTLCVLNPWTGQIDERETRPMEKVVFMP